MTPVDLTLAPFPVAKKDLVFDSEHPESLQKLQYLDDSSRYQRRETMEEVSVKIKPKFLTKLKDVTLREGMHAHFEAKIEPITDPNLRIEWLKDGQPIQMGSRFRLIHDFGYVALDISDLIEEDSGVYTCVATNLMGKDEITANLKCLSELKRQPDLGCLWKRPALACCSLHNAHALRSCLYAS